MGTHIRTHTLHSRQHSKQLLQTNTMADKTTPSQLNGQIQSVVGTGEQMLGSAIEQAYQAVGGSTEPSQFSKDGKERHDKGEAELKAAQAKDYAEGTLDRVEGKADSIIGSIKGDDKQQLSGNLQNKKGQAAQQQAS